MEVKGAALLYTLATLAVTFAGFAALLVIIRQSAGSALWIELPKILSLGGVFVKRKK